MKAENTVIENYRDAPSFLNMGEENLWNAKSVLLTQACVSFQAGIRECLDRLLLDMIITPREKQAELKKWGIIGNIYENKELLNG